MPTRLTLVATAAALAMIATALILAACTSSDGPTGGDLRCDKSSAPELHDGILSVGAELDFEPINFVDAETAAPSGLDIDLAGALARSLCVDLEFIRTDFGRLIEAVNAHEFDIILSGMTITTERSQNVDYIPYADVGTAIIVRDGNPTEARSLADLCGLAVAVQVNTIQVGQLAEQDRVCRQTPEGPIDILLFDTTPQAVSDLTTAGSDASITDFPAAFVAVKESSGRLELLEEQIEPLPYGIGVRKDSTALNSSLSDALVTLVCTKEYEQILEAWSLGTSTIVAYLDDGICPSERSLKLLNLPVSGTLSIDLSRRGVGFHPVLTPVHPGFRI